MKFKPNTIAVIGAGAWGTALATVAAKPGRRVLLWTRDPDHAAAINQAHENARDLPGIALSPAIRAVHDPAELAPAEVAVVAVPARAFVASAEATAGHLASGTRLVIATKGTPPDSDLGLYGTGHERFPGTDLYLLSGPSFAGEVARGLPSAVTLAGMHHGDVIRLGNALATPAFRIYFSTDIAGVQAGGAIKNVLAIACGIADGLKLGDSARAALITRSSFELIQLGRRMGGQYETLQGMAGLGDLILTATSRQSRNFMLGVRLGQGMTLAEALALSHGPCEGVASAPRLAEAAKKLRDGAPILDEVAAILAGRSTPRQSMERLLDRPLKFETA